MPNVAKVLKEEISRLSRKEARNATARLEKSNATLRGTVASLRKEVSGLKAEQKRMASALTRLAKAAGEPPPAEEFRMTSRSVRSLRKKLSLTQAEFGELLGVSAQAVFLWESKGGRLTFRGNSEAALKDALQLDAPAARERLSGKSRRKKAGSKRRGKAGSRRASSRRSRKARSR